jgi:hypothetical protein
VPPVFVPQPVVPHVVVTPPVVQVRFVNQFTPTVVRPSVVLPVVPPVDPPVVLPEEPPVVPPVVVLPVVPSVVPLSVVPLPVVPLPVDWPDELLVPVLVCANAGLAMRLKVRTHAAQASVHQRPLPNRLFLSRTVM